MSKAKNTKYFINVAIVIVIMVFFRFIPTFGSMTTLGMTVLGIFIGALYGWITCDMIWPSILALVMLGLSDYGGDNSVSTVLTTAVSNSNVQLMLWLLVFSALLTTTGVSRWLVSKLVNSKFCIGHPWRFSVIICFAVYLCASFGAGFAAMLICWDLVYSISEQVGYTKKDKWPKMMVVSIVVFNVVGVCILPFMSGTVSSMSYLATASENAYTYGSAIYLQYLIFSLLFSVCTLIIFVLCCRFIIRPDMSKLSNKIEMSSAEKLTTRQKIAIGALIALFVLAILPGCLPTCWLKTFLNNIGTTAITLFIVGFVTVLRDKEGKPFFTFRDLANGGIMWPMMFMVSTAIVFGSALSSADSGFTATLTTAFSPILENTSPYLFAIVIALFTMILTNIINNGVAVAIMVPIMYPFVSTLGINPFMMTSVIIFCANCGLLLPCASPAGAMMHSNKEWINTGEIVRYSLLGLGSILLTAIVVGIPVGGIIFG